MFFKEPKRTVKNGPEQLGLQRLRKYMESNGWLVKKLHGGQFQSGFPDLYCVHPKHGHRWIEMKAPKGKLRESQCKFFFELEQYGDQVYVLENETNYSRLFNLKGNWKEYV